jgi:hypothetical protein
MVAMLAMPTMTDAANEKIVRRDMITVLPRLPKNAYSRLVGGCVKTPA